MNIINSFPDGGGGGVTANPAGTASGDLTSIGIDGTKYDIPTVTVDNALSPTSENPVQNKVINTALANKADVSVIPATTSDLTNDSGFITNTVNNLANYYLKSESYTKSEVDTLIGAITTLDIRVVATLPTTDISTTTIYLVPSDDPQSQNVKNEYINLDGTSAGWELIGTTEIDLSDYITDTDLATALADYTTTANLTTLLATKVDKVSGKGLSANDYTNADKAIVDGVEDNIIGNTNLIKDTVGWTGKNLITYPYADGNSVTHKGVTWVVNADGSVTANGTATDGDSNYNYSYRYGMNNTPYTRLPNGNYILTGCPSNGSSSTYRMLVSRTKNSSPSDYGFEYGSGLAFTVDGDDVSVDSAQLTIRCIVRSGQTVSNLTFYPMIRKADILDDTYEPYHVSVENTLRSAEVVEGKNLLKNTMVNHTSKDVAFAVASDGVISLSGTSSDNIDSTTGGYIGNLHNLPNGKYKLTGCPANGSSSTYRLVIISNATPATYTIDTGEGAEFEVTDSVKWENVFVRINSGINMTDKVYKPMIRLVTETDPTYEPYYVPLKDSMFPREEQRVLGAKNLFNNKASTKTVDGITFTINADGSVTINGTSTNAIAFDLSTANNDTNLKTLRGNYIFSVNTSEHPTISLQKNDNSSYFDLTSGNESFELSLTDSVYLSGRVHIYIGNNKTFSNLRIYPMMRLASDPDDTYTPYAMTNAQLTDKNFVYDRILDSTDDLDNIIKTGIYYIGSSVVNSPENKTYCSLIVNKHPTNSSAIVQMVYTSDVIYTRRKGGSPAAWGDWKKYSDDSVSYLTSDSTETILADNDNFPFYDTSASAKKKSTWGNIKTSVKSYLDNYYEPIGGGGSAELKTTKVKPTLKAYWNPKQWNGITQFSAGNIWTDGDNIYYSGGTSQYVLDKSTSTWYSKTWSGLTDFSGFNIWTDGDTIYYSSFSSQYSFNKITNAWYSKIWSGNLISFDGASVWTDGDNIYYSNSTTQYVLDVAQGSWTEKTWNGLVDFSGQNIWTDGENIYYSYPYDNTQYVLDKSTSTWSPKTWNGLTSVGGQNIWTDGKNIYHSNFDQYVLDKETSTWSATTWGGYEHISGADVWTDGDNIYYSSYNLHYVLRDGSFENTNDNSSASLAINPTSSEISEFSDGSMWLVTE